MANTFKNYPVKAVGIDPVTIDNAAAITTVIGMSLSNILNTQVLVDVYITILGVDYYIVKNAPIPPGAALIPIGGEQKLVLDIGNVLKVKSDTATSVDVILSVLELT